MQISTQTPCRPLALFENVDQDLALEEPQNPQSNHDGCHHRQRPNCSCCFKVLGQVKLSDRFPLLQLQPLQHLVFVQSSTLRRPQDPVQLGGKVGSLRVLRVGDAEKAGWVTLRQDEWVTSGCCRTDCKGHSMLAPERKGFEMRQTYLGAQWESRSQTRHRRR